MLKNVQPPYSLKMATLIYTIYINLTWGRIKPEEVPIKTTRTFSKAWNAGKCPSNNQRQHDTLSEEGNVLEITDRYTYNKQFLFSWQMVNIGLSFLFFSFFTCRNLFMSHSWFHSKNFYVDVMFFILSPVKNRSQWVLTMLVWFKYWLQCITRLALLW